MSTTPAVGEQEKAALLQSLEPLPLSGTAWPGWCKAGIWIVLLVIGIQLIRTATSAAGQGIAPAASGSIIIAFGGLLVVARYIHTSTVRITHEGIEQSWITRRAIRWDDIRYAKFVPLPASKRLICFTGRSRPVVFQAGTPDLQTAFALIALTYYRRN